MASGYRLGRTLRASQRDRRDYLTYLQSGARHGGIARSQPIIGAWTAGSNTTLSISGGRARATRAGGDPRIYRHVSNLIAGADYRVQSNTYAGPGVTEVAFRVANDAELLTSIIVENTVPGAVDLTFKAPASGEAYIGIAVAADVDGEYGETDEHFTLTII